MSILTNPALAFNLTANLAGGIANAPTRTAIADATAINLNVGTASGNVNLAYSGNVSVVSGTPLVIDLTALTNPDGGAVSFTNVLAVKLTNNGTAAGTLTMGGGTNPVFGAFPVAAQGGTNGTGVTGFYSPNGITVAGGSSNNLQIVSSAGTVPGSLTILGR